MMHTSSLFGGFRVNVPSLVLFLTLTSFQSHTHAFIPTTSKPHAPLYFRGILNRNLRTKMKMNMNMSKLKSTLSSSSESSGSKEEGKHIVLVGGGHAHLQVIKALNKQSRPNDWSVTLIDKTDKASYSGMVPGCVAKLYETKEQTQIPLRPLAHWADVDFINDEVVGIDFDTQEITILGEGGGIIPYDVLSLDIGSTARGLDLPGVMEYTIPTRPIDVLVHKIEKAEKEWIENESESDELDNKSATDHIIVVGAGAAGIELAMGLRARFDPIAKNDLEVTILDSGFELMSDESTSCKEALKDTLKRMRVNVRHGCRVKRVGEHGIELEEKTLSLNDTVDGMEQSIRSTTIPYSICCWATGAHPHKLSSRLKDSGLSVNDNGWIRVGPTLQTISHDNVFAAGDCSEIEGLRDPVTNIPSKRSPPKAGVYAVRSGPILIENITRYLKNDNSQSDSHSLIPYEPQTDFLKLIMCGDGTALGFRFGLPLYGKWVWELKDHIDEMFMDLFRVQHLPDVTTSKTGNDEIEVKGRSEGNTIEERSYDTSQYDEHVIQSNRLSAEEGAKLLVRTDDSVDYECAWRVLRDMMGDEEYKVAVLKSHELLLASNLESNKIVC